MSAGEANEDRSGVRVRWVIAGAFTAAPTGSRWSVSTQSYGAALEGARLAATATVPDRLGADAKRTLPVVFPTIKSFQVADVVAAVPVLRDLAALAQQLGSTDAAKRPDAATALGRIADLVGEGKLLQAVRAKIAPAAAPATPPAATAPAAAPATPAPGDALEALLSSAEAPVPSTPTPRSAIDSFVRAMRGPSGDVPTTAPAAGRAARDLIEAEVFATAAEALRDASVARVEAAWRGLKLVLDATPADGSVAVEVIDVAPEGLLDALDAALPEDLGEAPDGVFLFDACDDVARLGALAQWAEGANVPVLVPVTPAFFGVADAGVVASRIEDEDGGLSPAWKALRADESSRWLCVVANRVVLRAEGTGASRRVVYGSPVAALAAMLTASFQKTGAFARVLGQPGGLKAPGAWELSSGRDAGMLVPTEAFFSIRAQTRLGALGIVGLGSGRNTDTINLSTAPTARAGEDLVPLSAQILTGRIVRFARWVLEQLPAGSQEEEVRTLFEQAAAVFLFPVASDGAKLEAKVVQQKDGGRSVILQASVRADQAGIPFHLGFALPLPA